MMGHYILKPGEPWHAIEATDFNLVKLYSDFGAFGAVSTIFLGTDHNWGYATVPVLWETLVFGGVFAEEQWRESSWCRALARHRSICRRIERVQVTFIAQYGSTDAAEAAWRLDGNVLQP